MDILVVSSLATVTDELEAANYLSDSEETEKLSDNDATGDKLGSADVTDGLKESAGRDGAGAERLEEVLVVGLEGGDGAIIAMLAQPIDREADALTVKHTVGTSSGLGRRVC